MTYEDFIQDSQELCFAFAQGWMGHEEFLEAMRELALSYLGIAW